MSAPAPKLPEALADVRDTLLRDAGDHSDHVEHMQVISALAECVRLVREISVGCARPRAFADVVEQIEQAAWPLEAEAHRWDDDRDARDWGNALDQRRAIAAE